MRVRHEHWLAWPYLGGLVLLVVVPAAVALAIAFTNFNAIRPPEFTGLDNFTRVVRDEAFWRALANTTIYIVIALPLRLAAAVAFALLLHRPGPGVGAARAIAYLPSVVPDAAYALLWLWFLNPIYGPISLALGAVGLEGLGNGLLTDPWSTRVAIAVMGAFQIGEAFVIALAARRLIPESLYDAARVDGAKPWFVLRRVTLPLMGPVLALLALRDVIFSLQANFVPALLITDGGPRYATTYLPLLVYRSAFRYFRFGYASAVTVSIFLITAIVVYLQYRLVKRWRLL
ncbi:MAG TPA: sugar ABC transporter permease [Actinomycetota bacterium]|nr:sugar ABC transporter permease [Actinomycetota bacterium]